MMTKLTNCHATFGGYFISGMLFQFDENPGRSWVVTSQSPDNGSHVYCVEGGVFYGGTVHWAHPQYGDLVIKHSEAETLDPTEEEIIRNAIKEWEENYKSGKTGKF